MIVEVGELIDMSITDFIPVANGLSFAGSNQIKKLLEMELYRVKLGRENLRESLAIGQDKVQEYITTYVVEQKLEDRIDIIESVRKEKGVDLDIFKA